MSLADAASYVQHVINHKTLFTHKTSDPEFDRPARLVTDTLKNFRLILVEIKSVQDTTEKFVTSLTKLGKVVCEYFNDKDSDLVVTDAKDFRTRQETIDSDCRRRLSARLSEEIVDVLTHKIEMLEKISKNCETRQKLKGELDHYASKVDKLKNNPKEDPVRIMRNDQKLSEAKRQIIVYDEVVKDQLKHYDKYHADLFKGEVDVIKSIEKEFFEGASKIVTDFDSSPDQIEYYDPPKHDVVPNINMSMTGMPGQMGMMGMPGQMGMMGMTGMPGQMGGYPGQMGGMGGMGGMQGMGGMGMTGMPGQMGGYPGQMGGMQQGMGGMPQGMGGYPGQMGGMQQSMGGYQQNQMGGMPGMGGMGMTAPPAPNRGGGGVSGQAIYEYVGQSPEELSLQAGDLITNIREDPSGWWNGTCNGRTGIFPGNYIQKL